MRKPRKGPFGPNGPFGPKAPSSSSDPSVLVSAVFTTETVRTWTTAGAASATMLANDGSPAATAWSVVPSRGVSTAAGAACACSGWVKRPAAKPPTPTQAARAPAVAHLILVEPMFSVLLWKGLDE